LKLREQFSDFCQIQLRTDFCARGEKAENVFAFSRGGKVIAIVPRFGLKTEPATGKTRRWNCRPETGATNSPARNFSGELRMENLFQKFPVALLAKKEDDLMHTFTRLGTAAKKRRSRVGAEKFPMAAQADGWWSAQIDTANIGDDYGFVLDGEGPFPDPRSASQPNGVHKLSRVVDQNKFQWTDKKWQSPPLASAVIYELHLGTFTPAGTFLSAIEKLDHLVALGVTHVELMPVAEFSGDARLGLRRRGLVRAASRLRHAGRFEKIGGRLPRARAGRRFWMSSIIILARREIIWRNSRRISPKKYAPTWGEALNYDGADCEKCAVFFATTR
jgi:hypothetical protein